MWGIRKRMVCRYVEECGELEEDGGELGGGGWGIRKRMVSTKKEDGGN